MEKLIFDLERERVSVLLQYLHVVSGTIVLAIYRSFRTIYPPDIGNDEI